MTKNVAEVLEALKNMTTEERLEVIEIASKLIREEIAAKPQVTLQKELSLAEAAEVMRSFYELSRWVRKFITMSLRMERSRLRLVEKRNEASTRVLRFLHFVT